MIVLINDESHLSDWCTFEWETARELEVPIRVVVDLERGNKAECLANATSFPGLLRFQWLELTPKMRREMLGDLLNFLHEYASPAQSTCAAAPNTYAAAWRPWTRCTPRTRRPRARQARAR